MKGQTSTYNTNQTHQHALQLPSFQYGKDRLTTLIIILHLHYRRELFMITVSQGTFKTPDCVETDTNIAIS
mgnify:FL=1